MLWCFLAHVDQASDLIRFESFISLIFIKYVDTARQQ